MAEKGIQNNDRKLKKDIVNKGKTPLQRHLLERIYNWNNSGKPCYESASTLSKELGVSPRTIQRNIKILVEKDLIECWKEKVIVKNGQFNNHYVIKGYDKMSLPCNTRLRQNVAKGYDKMSHNNINNNINNIYIYKYTFEEFQKLCIDGGIEKTSKEFEYAYNYILANGFKTSNGNEIADIVAYMKNWKWDDKNKQKKSSTDKYNQFQQNSYDFEELEKDLIAN